jgi:hypothetical protein
VEQQQKEDLALFAVVSFGVALPPSDKKRLWFLSTPLTYYFSSIFWHVMALHKLAS